MPEALSIIAVFFVTTAVLIGARLLPPDPDGPNAEAERLRLKARQAWLEHRLSTAQREGWDPEMSSRIAADHTATCDRIRQLGLPHSLTNPNPSL